MWQPEQAADAAQDARSYTTRRGMISPFIRSSSGLGKVSVTEREFNVTKYEANVTECEQVNVFVQLLSDVIF
jgi:alpha-D-ribose 1-methylphosphonate 5-triphosphate synthase subunit PhnI